MSEMKITFKHPDEILDFVNTVSKYCLLYTSDAADD